MIMGSEEDVDPSELQCGWCCFRPRFLQRFTTASWAIAALFINAMFLSMVANALIGIVLQSLETRYGLSTSQTGLISASYEISSTFAVIFLITAIKRYPPTKCIAVGAFVVGTGCLIFCLPQFFGADYDPADSSKKGIGSEWLLFVTGMMTIGVGSIPASVLAFTYFDENVKRKDAPLYHAVYSVGGFFGPLVGYTLGGQILKLPVDYRRESAANLGNDNVGSPSFVGAWWLPFFISAFMLYFAGLLVWPFPRYLKDRFKPGRNTMSLDDEAYSDDAKSSGKGIDISSFGTYKRLLRNKPMFFTNMAFVCDGFVIQAMIAFLVKYNEHIFNLTPSESSLGIAIVCIVGMLGQVTGAVGLSKLDYKIPTVLRMAIISPLVGVVTSVAFLIGCPTRQYAGAPRSTGDAAAYARSHCGVDIDEALCNSNCTFTNFLPVCDTMNKTEYFHKCFYGDGQCISSGFDATYQREYLIDGNCPDSVVCPDAKKQYYTFIAIVSIMFFFKSATATPIINVTMRCVEFKDREDALALSSFMFRIIGSIPSPLIVGKLIDNACILWAENENCEHTNCVSYNHESLQSTFFWMNAFFKCGTMIFFYLASKSYKSRSDALAHYTDNTVLVDADVLAETDEIFTLPPDESFDFRFMSHGSKL